MSHLKQAPVNDSNSQLENSEKHASIKGDVLEENKITENDLINVAGTESPITISGVGANATENSLCSIPETTVNNSQEVAYLIEENSDVGDVTKEEETAEDPKQKEDTETLSIYSLPFSDSADSISSSQTFPEDRKPSIVQERLEIFRRIQKGNRSSRLRRSLSVPNSPEHFRRKPLVGDEQSAEYQKVRNRYRKSKMTEEDSVQYGGVSVKPGYVKALVNQINKNKTNRSEGLNLTPSNESGDKDEKIQNNINGDSSSVLSDEAPHSSHNGSNSSSNRNSIKSSECGTTSSGHDKTENESGIVSDAMISLNAEELFDSSWSESDIDSLHTTDSGDESCTIHDESGVGGPVSEPTVSIICYLFVCVNVCIHF